jgi:hypothetical protein
MGEYTSGGTIPAGLALRPPYAILSTATVSPVLREWGLFNSSVTECIYRLVSFTGGTAGATQTARRLRRNAPPALCLPKALYTADITVVEDLGYRIKCGAAHGSGGILTFGGSGIEMEVGATAGIGLVPVGTGQACETYFKWEE